MAHTTKYGNTYTDQEWKEVQEMYRQEEDAAVAYINTLEDSIAKAVAVLHNEFPDVPRATWNMAFSQKLRYVENPREIKFTSEQKQARFEAASKWIDAQLAAI